MQLALAQLAAHLGKGALAPLYTVHGDEPLLVQEAADAIRAAARAQGFSERTVHTVAGAHFDWGAVLAATSSMSLFGDRQLLDLRIPSGKPGKEGGAALQQLAEGAEPGGGVLVLVTLPRLDRTTQATAWFGALVNHGVALAVEPVARAALPQWIAQRLARQGQRVPAGEEGQRALQFFADRVEGNLLAAHQEVEKLALLHGPGELGLAQIEAAVLDVARYDVFKLSEAVLAGQTARALRMLDGLAAEGEAPVLVHYTLAEDIRALARARAALDEGRPLPLALREARVWGAKERLFEQVLPRLQREGLDRLVQSAHKVDGIVKGLKPAGWPHEAWAALQRLVLELARAASPPGRPSPRGTIAP